MKHSLFETAIGAAVLLFAAVFLVFSYSTANQGDGSLTGRSYKLQAVFDNVGGLKVGDNVMISGVKVGTVSDITLDDKLYRAQVAFTVNETVKLATDTSARISSEGLLGGRFLDLQPGGDDADLKTGDVITMTQAPANLEDLLGRFIFSVSDAKKKDGTAPENAGSSAPAPAAADTLPESP